MITPRQCRAARGLLGFTQADLAEKAGMSKTGLNNFESGKSSMKSSTQKSLRLALENSGIDFTPGEGVRLRTHDALFFQGANALTELMDHMISHTRSQSDGVCVYHNDASELEKCLNTLKSNETPFRVLTSCEKIAANTYNGRVEFLASSKHDFSTPKFIYGDFVAMRMMQSDLILVVSSKETAEAERLHFNEVWHDLTHTTKKTLLNSQ